MAVMGPVNLAASMLSVVATGWLASATSRGLDASVGGLHVGRIDVIFTACALVIVLAGVLGSVSLSRLLDNDQAQVRLNTPSVSAWEAQLAGFTESGRGVRLIETAGLGGRGAQRLPVVG